MDLRKQIEIAINSVSSENGSNTPDFILAEYLTDSLAAFDKAVRAREIWYGRTKNEIPGDHPTTTSSPETPFTVSVTPPASPKTPGSYLIFRYDGTRHTLQWSSEQQGLIKPVVVELDPSFKYEQLSFSDVRGDVNDPAFLAFIKEKLYLLTQYTSTTLATYFSVMIWDDTNIEFVAPFTSFDAAVAWTMTWKVKTPSSETH